jgi:hypothetical protein
MTANARVCGKNSVDDSRVVLTSSASEILPLSNVQLRARGRIVRYAAASGVEMKGTYGGEAVRATMFSPYRHNLEPDGTVRFRGYSDAAWTTLVIDTGDRPAVPTATLDYLDSGIDPLGISIFSPKYRLKRTTVWFDDADMLLYTTDVILSWKVTISDPTNTSGYMDISRLWIAKHFELEDNPVYGGAMSLIDESQTYRTDGSTPRNDAGAFYRGGKFDVQNFHEADRAMWASISQYCGAGRRPFFFSLFPSNDTPALTAAHDGEFIFKNPLPQLTHAQTSDRRYSTTINIEET